MRYIYNCCLFLAALLLIACTGYKNDGKTVTYHWFNEGSGHSYRVLEANPATFEDLGDDFARDDKHAFYWGYRIPHADGATFQYLGHQYSKDKRHVFRVDSIIQDADPKTFKVHTAYLTEDKNDFYWYGRPIQVADKKTFVIVGDIDDYHTKWGKDRYNVYFLGWGFVQIADYESFRLVPKQKGVLCSGNYAADKYHVYFENHIVPGADPATFREVEFYVGQDKYRTYKKWEPTSVKDFSSLKEIGVLFTDGKRVYDYDLKEINGVNVASFRQLDNSNWYVDKTHVWWRGTIVSGADPQTFRPLHTYTYFTGKREDLGIDWNYGLDAHHVYFRDSVIVGADPESFEKIDFPDVKTWTVFDKNHIYEGENSKTLMDYLKKKNGK